MTDIEEDPIKQWIIIRKDLKMRLGKSIAQGAHASMGAILKWQKMGITPLWAEEYWNPPREYTSWSQYVRPWLDGSFTKIALFCQSEEELLALNDQATKAGLLTYLIQDSGKTEFNNVPTYTALAIGPAPKSMVKPIVGHLQLA